MCWEKERRYCDYGCILYEKLLLSGGDIFNNARGDVKILVMLVTGMVTLLTIFVEWSTTNMEA